MATKLTGPVESRRLKASDWPDLHIWGSSELLLTLIAAELVDEFRAWVFPLVLGQGTRLFADSGPDAALDLVDSRFTPKGLSIQVYRPAGRPQYASATAD